MTSVLLVQNLRARPVAPSFVGILATMISVGRGPLPLQFRSQGGFAAVGKGNHVGQLNITHGIFHGAESNPIHPTRTGPKHSLNADRPSDLLIV